MNDFSLLDDLERMEEMPNYRFTIRGLNHVIWFDRAADKRRPKHSDARLKYGEPPERWIPVAICDDPYIISSPSHPVSKELINTFLPKKPKKLLFAFIRRNIDLLLQYWCWEIELDELITQLQEAEELRRKRRRAKGLIDEEDLEDDDKDEFDDSILALMDDEEDEQSWV